MLVYIYFPGLDSFWYNKISEDVRFDYFMVVHMSMFTRHGNINLGSKTYEKSIWVFIYIQNIVSTNIFIDIVCGYILYFKEWYMGRIILSLRMLAVINHDLTE